MPCWCAWTRWAQHATPAPGPASTAGTWLHHVCPLPQAFCGKPATPSRHPQEPDRPYQHRHQQNQNRHRREQAESIAMQDLGIISPGLEEFRELAGHSRVIPVRLKVLADAETPSGCTGSSRRGSPARSSWNRRPWAGPGPATPSSVRPSRATLTTKDGNAHWLGEPPVGVPVGGNPVDAIRDTIEALRTDRFEGPAAVHLRPGGIPRLGNGAALGTPG
jgi:hypothetical protein